MPNIFQDEMDYSIEIERYKNQENSNHFSKRKHTRSLTDGLPSGRVELGAVTSVLLMLVWLFAWQIMPFNKINHLTVTGNELTSSESIIVSSGIREIDDVKEIMKNRQKIEDLIIEANPMVSSIVFERAQWNQFNLNIVEHQVVGFVEVGADTYPLLENGELLDTVANNIQIQKAWENFPFVDTHNQKGKLVDVAAALGQIEPEILTLIDRVSISTNLSKPNGIELYMNDGMYIKAITNTLAEKINQYPKMKQIIGDQVGMISLEVGAYFTPEIANANSVKLDANIDN